MDPRREQPRPRRRALRSDDLLSCPSCGSRLVERVDARPCADGRWHVERRCPECEWRGAGRWPVEAYRELDDHLAAARAALLRLLARVEGSHARRDVDASVEALRRDRLGPGDV